MPNKTKRWRLIVKQPQRIPSFLPLVVEAFYLLLGHIRDDLTYKPVRFLTFKWHYLIIYKPSNPIEIVRVLSGYRDIFSLRM